jgi:hypothetical protein
MKYVKYLEKNANLVETLVAAAVAALEGVAPGDAELPPQGHPGRRLPAALHLEVAVVQGESRRCLLQNVRQQLRTEKN